MKPRLPRTKRAPIGRKLFAVLFVLAAMIVCASYLWVKGGSSKESVRSADSPESTNVDRAIDDPRIVLLTHLSGPFEKEGEMLRLGVELAWADLQQKGTNGKLVVRDAGRNASATARLVSELGHDPKVVAVIGHLPVSSLVEVAPVLEQEKLLMIVPANSHQQIIQHSWLLPLVCLDGEEGAYAALIAKDWAKDAATAVIYSPSTYGELLYEGFMSQAQSIKLATTAFSSDTDEVSLQDTVDRVLQVNPSVIWLAGSPFWGVEIISALTEKGYKGRLLVPRSYGEMLIEDLFGEYLNQLYVLRSVLVTDKNNDSLQEFTNRFRELYWREPRWLAVLGYDAMKWVGELLQNGPVKRSALRDFFLEYNSPMQAYQGLAGPVYFDANGQTQRPLQVTVYRNGRFMPFDERSKHKDSSS